MKLKEAKKILKKEGFILSLASKVINQTGAIREFEKPEVCEAIKVANANKWTIGLSPIEWNEREKRLKKEHEKNNKESAHDKKSMTLEEAKDMLTKEGFKLEGPGKPCDVSECFIELESPEICEAMQIVCSAGYMIMMEVCDFNARKARLKEQLEEHGNAPMPGPGEEQPKEKKGFIYPTTSPKADFYYKHVLNEGNPALKEAASQFNDALLDEQGKKIAEQNKEITRLLSLVEKKENSISRLYYEKSVLEKENEELKKGEIPAKYFDKDLVDEQAEKIKKLEHEKLDILEMASSCKQTVAERGKEIARLNKIIHKKNMKIEEFRKESSIQLRGKIKMFVENRDLEGKLKDKDAVLSDVAEELRLSKIREKNLTEVCQKYMKKNEELKKELADKVVDKIDAQALKSAESALVEKDEVIADLGNELAATKKELEEKTKQVETVRKGSKEYCEYGISAEKMIRKMANVIVYKGKVSSKEFEEYRRWANGYRFNPQLYDFIEEEEKKLTAKMVDINAKCMRAARESINDVFESYAAKYAKSTLDELKDKAYESFNAKAHKLGLVGSKDGKGIPDQMIRVDIAEELSKVLDDVIDQFLLFGEIIIKEEK